MQPVWMVINLQGKIKGSYTAEKMQEFCRRGTLGGAQLVLGMDRNLPYNSRQVGATAGTAPTWYRITASSAYKAAGAHWGRATCAHDMAPPDQACTLSAN
jgi:hypothetical protein